MEASALETVFRSEVDDTVGPAFLWTTTEFYDFLTDAEEQAALRKKLLRDQRSGFCRKLLIAGEAEYRLDPRIFQIDRARLQWPDASSDRYLELDLASIADQDADQRARSGRPCRLYFSQGRALLDRAPTSAGVLALEVYRLPLFPIEGPSDEPEIPLLYHRALLPWCYYRAYNKRDAISYNPERANAAKAEFERVFGPPIDAKLQRARTERRRVTTVREF